MRARTQPASRYRSPAQIRVGRGRPDTIELRARARDLASALIRERDRAAWQEWHRHVAPERRRL